MSLQSSLIKLYKKISTADPRGSAKRGKLWVWYRNFPRGKSITEIFRAFPRGKRGNVETRKRGNAEARKSIGKDPSYNISCLSFLWTQVYYNEVNEELHFYGIYTKRAIL